MKRLKRTAQFIITFLLILAVSIFPISADEIDDLENENNELESQIAEEKERVAQIQSEITDIEEYIEALDEEMERIQGIIDDYKAKKEEKQATVDTLNAKVDELKAKILEEEDEIDHQYDLMSLRIKFLYENVGNSYIEAIFSAGSFSEAVEKIQYLLEITEYDHKVMVKVQNMLDQVESDKAEVETEISTIETEMSEIDELQAAQEAQEELYEETKVLQEAELEKKNSELGEAQAVIDSFTAEVAANEDKINTLIEEYEAELARQEAERKAAEEAAAAETTAAQDDEEDYNDDADDSGDSDDYSYSSSGFIWPLSGYSYITSYFGYRDDVDIEGISSIHEGIDIYAPEGTPIMAVADGVVLSSYYSDDIGYVVIIYHGGGLFTECHHMCQYAIVSVGQTVYQGQTIGYTGSTGKYCTGPHLHFGVSAGSDAYAIAAFVNPLNYY